MTADFVFTFSIVLAVTGQLLNAVTVLIDKHIVTNTSITKPGVYAFYVGLLSSVALILLPFGVVGAPSAQTIWLSLDIGFVFILSILFLYRALRHANATDVVAWLTAVSVATTFLLSSLILDEELPWSFPAVLALFIVGMLFVGHFRFYARSFAQTIAAGALFGFSAVLMKILFSSVDFTDGFFWSRIGNVFAALCFLSFPSFRKNVFDITPKTSSKTGLLIIGSRILSGLAFLLILYAIKLGSVSLVNALSALQFVFVFLLVFLFARTLPELFHHEFRSGHVAHKIIAMGFIIAGFLVLFL